MRVFRFDREAAVSIEDFGSHRAFLSRGVQFEGRAKFDCIYLEVGGTVGYHEAIQNQLFMCVAGAGWVTGADRRRVDLVPGQAAYWSAGELHTSGSEDGMMAIVVESDALDPRKYMTEMDLRYQDDDQ